ncbi:MAG: hypothetical protein A3F10_01350 [Coxiella sp. RIFCSPHIGHO2_12_FULL_42_15]|nr:MAG: hypothetical protein A3F10_01350 [Coxiella sp. RIFCSPHIGHO2_12_FULL_42_15]
MHPLHQCKVQGYIPGRMVGFMINFSEIDFFFSKLSGKPVILRGGYFYVDPFSGKKARQVLCQLEDRPVSGFSTLTLLHLIAAYPVYPSLWEGVLEREGIDLNAKVSTLLNDLEDRKSRTALDFAIETGQAELALKLIDKGAKFDPSSENANKLLRALVLHGKIEEAKELIWRHGVTTGGLEKELCYLSCFENEVKKHFVSLMFFENFSHKKEIRIAFLMGGHKRLGAESPVRKFPVELREKIISFLPPPRWSVSEFIDIVGEAKISVLDTLQQFDRWGIRYEKKQEELLKKALQTRNTKLACHLFEKGAPFDPNDQVVKDFFIDAVKKGEGKLALFLCLNGVDSDCLKAVLSSGKIGGVCMTRQERNNIKHAFSFFSSIIKNYNPGLFPREKKAKMAKLIFNEPQNNDNQLLELS